MFFKRKRMKYVLTEEDKKWNKMWDLWVNEELPSPYYELMTYDSEVQNGGHLQFFENENNLGRLDNDIESLKNILNKDMYDCLLKAYEKWKELNLSIDTVDEYVEVEDEDYFNEADTYYYNHEEYVKNTLKEYSLTIELGE
jgi:hypothetical protein